MLNVDSSILLTTVPVSGDSTATIALVLGIVALLFAFAAYVKARRAASGQSSGQADSATASAPSATAAVSAAGHAAGFAATDDRQLVAVITAAISAVMASESGAAGTGITAVGSIRSIRRVAGPAMAAPTSTGSGPYAGFVVRRIRRV